MIQYNKEYNERIKKICSSSGRYSVTLRSKKNLYLYNYIESCVDGFLDESDGLGKKINWVLNEFQDFPECANPKCHNKVNPSRDISWDDPWKKYCSNRCTQSSPENLNKIKMTKLERYGDSNYNAMDKARETNLRKYGVEYTTQLESTKEKIRQTYVKNGYVHPMHSDNVKKKLVETCRRKYGVECSFQNEEVKDKIRKTNNERYGVDYPTQNKDILKKSHGKSSETQRRLFYRNNLCSKSVKPMFSEDDYTKATGIENEFLWHCTECGRDFKSRIDWNASDRVPVCRECHPFESGTSGFEHEVADFMKSVVGSDFDVLNGTEFNRNALGDGHEIDILVRRNGKAVLGVECDGLYWHSEAYRGEKYHLSKTERCSELGFQLVHLFEDEWKVKNEISKSRLKNLLGVYDRIIYARKCSVVLVSNESARKFLYDNHIQGYCPSGWRYGLELEGELVSLMTFGRKRKIYSGSGCGFELLRFCNKLGCHVPGAASRLLKHFESDVKPVELVSYADRRWSNGKLYGKLGFELDHVSRPNYWYLDPRFTCRKHRFGFRKSELKRIFENYDEDKTEVQIMKENGYSRIWDCGNLVYRKTYG